MVIGILHEGEYDYDSLKIFIEKIFLWRLAGKNIRLDFVGYCADGSTPSKFSLACTYFLEAPLLESKSDLIIFHSDLDNDSNKRQNCISLRDNYIRGLPGTHIALALPDPHLEQWFFAEVDSLIRYFNFRSGVPTIDASCPKDYLKAIIKRYSDITLKTREVYQGIADQVDIKKLYARDSNFKYFTDDLINKYNDYIRQP